MTIFKFGDFYLNFTERKLLKNGKFIELTPKALDVLVILVKNGGEIVSKDEILGKVWNGSFVEEGNLAVHISKLRRLLSGDKRGSFIETISGSGYRFVSAVKAADHDEWEKQFSKQNPSKFESPSDEFIFNSIAVLPLANESDNAEIDYLADGLTESFINALSHVSGLKVIARNTVFRYKNKDADAKEIGETLGVATILTGRIRLIKDRLMFSVELTKTADGTHLWGKHFNHPFSDIIEVQEEIISTVSRELQTEIESVTQNNESAIVTNNAESYKFYLMGKHLYDKCTPEHMYKAIKCFQESILSDPSNVHSYAEIVNCHLFFYVFDYVNFRGTFAKVTPLLKIISVLRQNIDSVQVMWGKVNILLEQKFEEAEKNFRYALKINPNSLAALICYADILVYLGEHFQAMAYLNKIIQIDFLSAHTYRSTARLLYRMDMYKIAIDHLNNSLELECEDHQTLTLLGACLIELQRYDEANKYLYQSLTVVDCVETLSMIGYSKALEGKSDEAWRIIDQIESRMAKQNEPVIHLARIYAALGENEIAFEYLNCAFINHETDLIALNSDPRWKKLRIDPKFVDLCNRISLPT